VAPKVSPKDANVGPTTSRPWNLRSPQSPSALEAAGRGSGGNLLLRHSPQLSRLLRVLRDLGGGLDMAVHQICAGVALQLGRRRGIDARCGALYAVAGF